MSGEKISPMPQGWYERLKGKKPIEFGKIHVVRLRQELLLPIGQTLNDPSKLFVGFEDTLHPEGFDCNISSARVVLTMITPENVIQSALQSLSTESQTNRNIQLSVLGLGYEQTDIKEIMEAAFAMGIPVFFTLDGFYTRRKGDQIPSKINQLYSYTTNAKKS